MLAQFFLIGLHWMLVRDKLHILLIRNCVCLEFFLTYYQNQTACISFGQVFHDVAYKAKDRNDLVAGIDEFLDQVTVLPPGEWDPTIRIEPPKNVPSQVCIHFMFICLFIFHFLPTKHNGAVSHPSTDSTQTCFASTPLLHHVSLSYIIHYNILKCEGTKTTISTNLKQE